jgi:hypothetical protein
MDIEHDVSQGYGNTWGRGLDRETIKNRLMAREYEVEIGVWFSRAWQLYKSHWQIITLWGVIYVVRAYLKTLQIKYFEMLEIRKGRSKLWA